MGTGLKYDISKEGNRYNAAPSSYTIASVFDMNKFKSKGSSLRVSRDVLIVIE